MEEQSDITHLIAEWQRGNKAAENALFEALYRRLHAIALFLVRAKDQNRSIGATTLVHEAYLRLIRSGRLQISDRQHFMRLAARVMHRILVDRARARLSAKRGGDFIRVDEADELVQTDADADEILAVDQALEILRRRSPRQAELVVLRYYGGYTLEESSVVIGVSSRTLKRDWDQARVRLQETIEGMGRTWQGL